MGRIGLIGFGEAARTFVAAGLPAIAACDIKPERRDDIRRAGLRVSQAGAEAASGVDLLLSLVTADQAEAAAVQTTAGLQQGALYLDMNSVAPTTKRSAGAAVEAAGARYLDVAIMAPVRPGALAVPLLVSGPEADTGVACLRAAGFTNVRSVGAEIGRASAIKMIRSVMIKGIEALTAEMMAGAAAAGVTDEVLASLSDGWDERAAYNLERMATHGLRRAAEMEESVKTLLALGVDPVMTRGTVVRQRAAVAAPQELAA